MLHGLETLTGSSARVRKTDSRVAMSARNSVTWEGAVALNADRGALKANSYRDRYEACTWTSGEHAVVTGLGKYLDVTAIA